MPRDSTAPPGSAGRFFLSRLESFAFPQPHVSSASAPDFSIPASEAQAAARVHRLRLSRPNFLTWPFALTVLFLLFYLAAAICCLRQWDSPHPWARVDVFSGGFLLISMIWLYGTVQFHRGIFRSRELISEAVGTAFDPSMLFWINFFAVAELTVFLDYGHWHLVPLLEKTWLQSFGLGLYSLGALWLVWTDRYLSRQFQGNPSERKVLTDGPYRFVRHPRYSALIAARFAFALSLASILAWGFALGWLWVNLQRVQLEEAHLHSLFGEDYDAYAARTPRFFPRFH